MSELAGSSARRATRRARPSRRTRGIAVGVALIVAALAGCAAGTPSSAPTTAAPGSGSSSAGATRPATTTTSIPGETPGAQVFRTRCAACHGTAGEGSLGPPLVGISTKLARPDEIAVVQQGRSRMPAFAPALSDEQIAAVVDYTRTQLG